MITSTVPDPVVAQRGVAQPSVRWARTALDWVEATAMLHDYAAWLRAVAGIDVETAQPAFTSELADLAGAYATPESQLLVSTAGPLLGGMVAVRHHDDGSAELKRMYVRPVARGGGHADALVSTAIRATTRQGAGRIWLETLPGPMDPAVSLYRRHGFRPLPGGRSRIEVPGVILMERTLRD